MASKGTNDQHVLAWLEDDPATFEERVLDRLQWDVDGNHMLWTGAVANSYGYVGVPWKYVRNRAVPVHRAVWLRHHGPIGDGLVVDHDISGCRNRLCANIDHLRLDVDGVCGLGHLSHCPKCGSQYSVIGPKARRCQECKRRYMVAYNAARKVGQ